jgi:hypothetical protein
MMKVCDDHDRRRRKYSSQYVLRELLTNARDDFPTRKMQRSLVKKLHIVRDLLTCEQQA